MADPNLVSLDLTGEADEDVTVELDDSDTRIRVIVTLVVDAHPRHLPADLGFGDAMPLNGDVKLNALLREGVDGVSRVGGMVLSTGLDRQ